jgi:hypothetical protein
VKEHPKDAQGEYTLGRLYSLAFAKGMTVANVATKRLHTHEPLPLPGFAPYDTIRIRPAWEGSQRNPGTLGYLTQSVTHYQNAARLSPGEALHWLGPGWMLQQGAAYADEVDAPFLPAPGRASVARWRREALSAYRRAYELSVQKELSQEMIFAGVADPSISLEAGEGILQLLGPHPIAPADRAEVAAVQRSITTARTKMRGVTPIIFPLDAPTSLDALLAPNRLVTFDLAGDGGGERWPWVGPNTGILVWDPGKTGRITSGRQLFGSVTWWMFWKDGYQALAALDDDQNGWLEGAELDGLAVWCDRNGNGVSDPGEVQPLAQFGITRVAVRPAGRSSGALWNPAGLALRRDGTFLPTYDWTPTALSAAGRGTAVR